MKEVDYSGISILNIIATIRPRLFKIVKTADEINFMSLGQQILMLKEKVPASIAC